MPKQLWDSLACHPQAVDCSADEFDEISSPEDKKRRNKDEHGLQEGTGPGEDEVFRAIERFFPSEAVSERSQRERYQRGKTPHTIFTWWARRPFAAACAVMTTSLIRSTDLKKGARDLVDEYCRNADPGVLRLALDPIVEADDQRVLDLFGGGGTIPIEAAGLGARAYTVENNELAHFTQSALLELSQHDKTATLIENVEKAGKSLLEELRDETHSFFPARYADDSGRTIAYLWTREVQCPECEGWLSLMRRPWISKQNGRKWYVERHPMEETKSYSVSIKHTGEPADDASAWQGNEIQCPFCDHRIERDDISEIMKERTRDRMVVTCTSEGRYSRTRKQFRVAEEATDIPGKGVLQAAIASDLNAMGEQLPSVSLPRWSGVTNPSLYGMARHVELYNLRQRAVLVRLCRLLREHHLRWEQELGTEQAAVVAAFLSGLVDQLVDWNSRLSTWISQNEQVGRGLSGPGMAMVWDHVEIDPLEEAPANLWDKLDRIIEGMRSIPTFRHQPTAIHGDARDLPFENQYFDVIATDPPYFDNIFYSVLADCIYVWKRLALQKIFPDSFRPESTDSSRELTMNRHVHKDSQKATEYYTEGMTTVLKEARRVLKPSGVLALIFAHSTVEGWASIVSALVDARLQLVATWPMYVERRHRPRGMSSRAINTSFVLVAKRRTQPQTNLSWSRFKKLLEQRLSAEDRKLDVDENYGPDTRGRTLFGLGISLYSQTATIIEDETPLSREDVVERIAILIENMIGEDAWGVRRG